MAHGGELRRQVDYECAGSDCPDAAEILALAHADIPHLNEVCAEQGNSARCCLLPRTFERAHPPPERGMVRFLLITEICQLCWSMT